MENRKETLLKAAYELLKKIDDGHYSDALLATAFYDESECDGLCLIDDIEAELEI